jgi:N-methylhydantoinase B
VALSDGTKLKGKGRQKVEPGQRLVLTLPGGGGYGDPSARERDKVRSDVAAGYITAEQAKSDYGLND